MKQYILSILATVLLCCILTVYTSTSFAQMNSSSYRIEFDSVNVGGARSTSSSYGLEDTVGEVATGDSASANYQVRAGYQQMNNSFISISSPSDFSFGNINGLSGGAATGSATWTVTTDNSAGYVLNARAGSDPALKSVGGAAFADYEPAAADPDFLFSIPATASEFGFSPEGVDTHARFKDNGSACNTGTLNTTDRCWEGFSTTDQPVGERSSSNHSIGGTATTLKIRAEIGTNTIQDSGTYSASIIVTAVTL